MKAILIRIESIFYKQEISKARLRISPVGRIWWLVGGDKVLTSGLVNIIIL